MNIIPFFYKILAAAAAFAGESGRMIAPAVSNYPYQCITESVDVQQVANLEKKVPLEWCHPRTGCR